MLAAAHRAVAAGAGRRMRRAAPRWLSPPAARPRTTRAAAALPRAQTGAPPHTPVLLDAVLDAFAPLRLATYLDGTLGAGGHAAAIAAAHPEMTRLVGLDVDAPARALASARLAPLAAAAGFRLDIVDANFRDMGRVLAGLDKDPHASTPLAPTAILLDLGFSSMQVDAPERGLSFTRDGPLDMRLARKEEGGDDDGSAITAADIVNTWTESALAALFRDAGEERHAGLAARRVVAARAGGRIESTRALAAAIGTLGPPARGGKGIHPATRIFQALRIAVNDELGALDAALPAALRALAPGGRLAVISFHSLEDRAVKRAFLTAAGRPPPEEGDAADRWLAEATAPVPPPPALGRVVTRRPVAATPAEAAANPRARSAKLRVFEKKQEGEEERGGTR